MIYWMRSFSVTLNELLSSIWDVLKNFTVSAVIIVYNLVLIERQLKLIERIYREDVKRWNSLTSELNNKT